MKKYWERVGRMHSDPAFRTEHTNALAEKWNSSDADADGKLNLEEYHVYTAKLK